MRGHAGADRAARSARRRPRTGCAATRAHSRSASARPRRRPVARQQHHELLAAEARHMSTPRNVRRQAAARWRSTASPAAWPWRSLTRLKWSASNITSDSGARRAAPALEFELGGLEEGAAVGQAGQVVAGDASGAAPRWPRGGRRCRAGSGCRRAPSARGRRRRPPARSGAIRQLPQKRLPSARRRQPSSRLQPLWSASRRRSCMRSGVVALGRIEQRVGLADDVGLRRSR